MIDTEKSTIYTVADLHNDVGNIFETRDRKFIIQYIRETYHSAKMVWEVRQRGILTEHLHQTDTIEKSVDFLNKYVS